MEQNLDHVLTWILEKKASWLTTFSMLQRLVSEKRDSRLNVLLIENVAKEKDILKSNHISNGWWRRFLTPIRPLMSRKTGGARVPTSAECLAMLEEKQSQKKKDTEEKEQRKKEREEKRKQREEEAKRKVAEREEKKKQREALKKKKDEEKKEKR